MVELRRILVSSQVLFALGSPLLNSFQEEVALKIRWTVRSMMIFSYCTGDKDIEESSRPVSVGFDNPLVDNVSFYKRTLTSKKSVFPHSWCSMVNCRLWCREIATSRYLKTGLGPGAFSYIVHVPRRNARSCLSWERASTLQLWLRFFLFSVHWMVNNFVGTREKNFSSQSNIAFWLPPCCKMQKSAWLTLLITLSTAMTAIDRFSERFARLTAIAAHMSTPFFCTHQSFLHNNQTSVTARSTKSFKTLLDISDISSLSKSFLPANTIASYTGRFLYRFFTSRRKMVSSLSSVATLNYPMNFRVYVSVLALGMTSNCFTDHLFNF